MKSDWIPVIEVSTQPNPKSGTGTKDDRVYRVHARSEIIIVEKSNRKEVVS